MNYISDTLENYLRHDSSTINERDIDGMTPLIQAITDGLDRRRKFRNELVISLLIKYGADVNLCDKDGTPPIIIALDESISERSDIDISGIKPILRCLIQAGANVNAPDSYGDTALLIVSRFSQTPTSEDLIELLIQAGANVNIVSSGGHTPLSHTVKRSSEYRINRCVRFLLDAGAKTNADPNLLNSAVDLSTKVTKWLINAGADPRTFDPTCRFNNNMQNNKMCVRNRRLVSNYGKYLVVEQSRVLPRDVLMIIRKLILKSD